MTLRSFTEHGLSEAMLELIPYVFCSEVQAATLEPILRGSRHVSHYSYIFSILLSDITMLALEVSNQGLARP
jgi:hypothetical protein